MKMLNKRLFLLCGPAGSGKSTWAQRQVKGRQNEAAWISRDNVRFQLVDVDEDYFSKEDLVFDVFIQSIQNFLANNRTKDIYVDATHLTEKARNKVLDLLDLTGCEVIPVIVRPGLKTTLEQNEGREGRAYVPRSVIRRMDAQFEKPTFNEKHTYSQIWEVKECGILITLNGGDN